MIYEFKVTLADVGIPVTRTIQIEGNQTFHDLHNVLQGAFDWQFAHLYSFDVRRYHGQPVENIEIVSMNLDGYEGEGFNGQPNYIDKEEKLSTWFKIRNDQVNYTYDFGDHWVHEIILLNKRLPEEGVTYPRCVDAVNLAPPEDSRFEVNEGKINLKNDDSQEIIDEINEWFRYHAITKDSDRKIRKIDANDVKSDVWYDLLQQTKEFRSQKPWEVLADHQVFMTVDPVTEEKLFCSVLGSIGEVYGLAVYIGAEGLSVLKETFSERAKHNKNILPNMRSLLLFFDDRPNLEEENYDFIKTYDVTFRGKNAWPTFQSMKPGFAPWILDEDEACLLNHALKQTIKMTKDALNGLDIPKFNNRTMMRSESNHQNELVALESLFTETTEKAVLEVDELTIKRIKKHYEKEPVVLEYASILLPMPIQETPIERPILPSVMLYVDHDAGIVLHQKVLDHEPHTKAVQKEFINVIEEMNALPEKVLIEADTATKIKPLLNALSIQVEVTEMLPTVTAFLENLQQDLNDH